MSRDIAGICFARYTHPSAGHLPTEPKSNFACLQGSYVESSRLRLLLLIIFICRYHGDCINITEKDSRKIKYFYCKRCRRKDPFLKIQYRKRKKIHDKDVKKSKKAKKLRETSPKPVKKKRTSVTERPKAKVSKVGSYNEKAEEESINVKSPSTSPHNG